MGACPGQYNMKMTSCSALVSGKRKGWEVNMVSFGDCSTLQVHVPPGVDQILNHWCWALRFFIEPHNAFLYTLCVGQTRGIKMVVHQCIVLSSSSVTVLAQAFICFQLSCTCLNVVLVTTGSWCVPLLRMNWIISRPVIPNIAVKLMSLQ